MVKALDLRSNGHMSAWVRTPPVVHFYIGEGQIKLGNGWKHCDEVECTQLHAGCSLLDTRLISGQLAFINSLGQVLVFEQFLNYSTCLHNVL